MKKKKKKKSKVRNDLDKTKGNNKSIEKRQVGGIIVSKDKQYYKEGVNQIKTNRWGLDNIDPETLLINFRGYYHGNRNEYFNKIRLVTKKYPQLINIRREDCSRIDFMSDCRLCNGTTARITFLNGKVRHNLIQYRDLLELEKLSVIWDRQPQGCHWHESIQDRMEITHHEMHSQDLQESRNESLISQDNENRNDGEILEISEISETIDLESSDSYIDSCPEILSSTEPAEPVYEIFQPKFRGD